MKNKHEFGPYHFRSAEENHDNDLDVTIKKGIEVPSRENENDANDFDNKKRQYDGLKGELDKKFGGQSEDKALSHKEKLLLKADAIYEKRMEGIMVSWRMCSEKEKYLTGDSEPDIEAYEKMLQKKWKQVSSELKDFKIIFPEELFYELLRRGYDANDFSVQKNRKFFKEISKNTMITGGTVSSVTLLLTGLDMLPIYPGAVGFVVGGIIAGGGKIIDVVANFFDDAVYIKPPDGSVRKISFTDFKKLLLATENSLTYQVNEIVKRKKLTS